MGNDYYQTLEEIVLKKDEIPMGIGKSCHIEHAIIAKDCRIGNHIIIMGGDDLPDEETDQYCIVGGIVVVKKRAIIPAESRSGRY